MKDEPFASWPLGKPGAPHLSDRETLRELFDEFDPNSRDEIASGKLLHTLRARLALADAEKARLAANGSAASTSSNREPPSGRKSTGEAVPTIAPKRHGDVDAFRISADSFNVSSEVPWRITAAQTAAATAGAPATASLPQLPTMAANSVGGDSRQPTPQHRSSSSGGSSESAGPAALSDGGKGAAAVENGDVLRRETNVQRRLSYLPEGMPAKVDFDEFCSIVGSVARNDDDLRRIYDRFVAEDSKGAQHTPPAMERNLFLSALANGKLVSNADAMLTAKRILAGGLAGMLAKSFVAPVDRIKILFQVTNERFSFNGVRALAKSIIEREGYSGLWRGNSATMIRVFPYAGTQFMVFDTLKRHLLVHKSQTHPQPHLNSAPQRLSNYESLVAGSVAGAVSAFVTYPLDLVRARLAVEVQHGLKRHNVISLLSMVLRNEGVLALYRGVSPSLLGVIPYAGIAFSINEWAKHEVRVVTGKEPGTLHKLGIGAFAGLIAQSCTYPLEVVRRRMQTHGLVDHHGGLQDVFSGKKTPLPLAADDKARPTILRTLRSVMQEQGPRGLFKGLSMNWVKGPIGISISFTTFDFLKRVLGVQQ